MITNMLRHNTSTFETVLGLQLGHLRRSKLRSIRKFGEILTRKSGRIAPSRAKGLVL